ncbi:sortase family protein [Bifidobacterium aquikefiri]|uniref:Sortase family protein n=2 Tax=Bifidobacterium aquikefiri TaxID=1653207 RepID=A0A261GCL0_9BIFI|nr:sortase family protein [Bifidobacterium aquikefiri]
MSRHNASYIGRHAISQSLEDLDSSSYFDDNSSEAEDAQEPMPRRPRHALLVAMGLVGEILVTLAVVCALYIAWQLWWTGVESEHTQLATRQSSSWTDPGNANGRISIAQAQKGNPPEEPASAQVGDLIAQLYIPRFGSAWSRNVVQGTTNEQLARHGVGHYTNTQMPGQVGNFAVAGHRAGYGEPLAHVDTLTEGDAIIVRTKDYWYVYHYTTKKIVLPTDIGVIAPNPVDPSAAAVKRMITLTTCEPRYTEATHRWISWGELDYWAKVSDGIPKELANSSGTSAVTFKEQNQGSVLARLNSLRPVVIVLLLAYAVIYCAALAVWRYPALRAIHHGSRPRPDFSFYGSLYRHQSGIAPIRWLLLLILAVAAATAMFEWLFPWMASNVPYLQLMSNYVSVQ